MYSVTSSNEVKMRVDRQPWIYGFAEKGRTGGATFLTKVLKVVQTGGGVLCVCTCPFAHVYGENDSNEYLLKAEFTFAVGATAFRRHLQALSLI